MLPHLTLPSELGRCKAYSPATFKTLCKRLKSTTQAGDSFRWRDRKWRVSRACQAKNATAPSNRAALDCSAVCTLVMSAMQPSSAGPNISPASRSQSCTARAPRHRIATLADRFYFEHADSELGFFGSTAAHCYDEAA